jgi:hypothetical protein
LSSLTALHAQVLGAPQIKVLRKVARGEGQAKAHLTKLLKDGEVYLCLLLYYSFSLSSLELSDTPVYDP